MNASRSLRENLLEDVYIYVFGRVECALIDSGEAESSVWIRTMGRGIRKVNKFDYI
jgi:hypothetical protein